MIVYQRVNGLAQFLCISLYGPFINLPFNCCAIYFDWKVNSLALTCSVCSISCNCKACRVAFSSAVAPSGGRFDIRAPWRAKQGAWLKPLADIFRGLLGTNCDHLRSIYFFVVQESAFPKNPFVCPKNPGLSRSHSCSFRMGLEPETSYSREGSGFLGVGITVGMFTLYDIPYRHL